MILYIIIVLLMGLVTPIQTAANARLRVCVGYAYVSTLVSFAVSALALVAVSLLVGTPNVPSKSNIISFIISQICIGYSQLVLVEL